MASYNFCRKFIEILFDKEKKEKREKDRMRKKEHKQQPNIKIKLKNNIIYYDLSLVLRENDV